MGPMVFGIRGFLVDGKRYFDGHLTHNWKCLPLFDDVDEQKDTILRVTCYHDVHFAVFREGWITPQLQLPRMWLIFPPCSSSLRIMWRLGYLRFIEHLAKSSNKDRLHEHFRRPSTAEWSQFATDLEQTIAELGRVVEIHVVEIHVAFMFHKWIPI